MKDVQSKLVAVAGNVPPLPKPPMRDMSEMALLKEIQMALTERGCRAFRVNVGAGWTGNETAVMGDGSVVIRHARRFQTGLPKGFPDLLVLCPNGRTVFMELKTPTGRPSIEQIRFHEFLRGMGHKACICRSVKDAIKAIEEVQNDGCIQD